MSDRFCPKCGYLFLMHENGCPVMTEERINTRKVELYIGNHDHTWTLYTCHIPEDISEEGIEEAAIMGVPTKMAQQSAFIGLYHYESLEGDEPQGYDLDDPDDYESTCDVCWCDCIGGVCQNEHCPSHDGDLDDTIPF